MTDDFAITMACLDAIEQEVRRAKLALLQAWGNATPHVGGRVNAEDCPRCAVDPPNYPFICPGDAPGTPAQDAHTPRERPESAPGTPSPAEGGGGASTALTILRDDVARLWPEPTRSAYQRGFLDGLDNAITEAGGNGEAGA